MVSVELISVTPNAEQTIAFCARVSNPKNQHNSNIAKLIRYCIEHKHWSIFEMANMVVEIKTSRAISPQILRHKSFVFQEFSQRYSEVETFEYCDARLQDVTNKQNSLEINGEELQDWFQDAQKKVVSYCKAQYDEALSKGIAKECARVLLPQSASTTLYMNGTLRSWIHYIELRTGNGTQREHQDIANACKDIFCEQFPIIANALGWIGDIE